MIHERRSKSERQNVNQEVQHSVPLRLKLNIHKEQDTTKARNSNSWQITLERKKKKKRSGGCFLLACEDFGGRFGKSLPAYTFFWVEISSRTSTPLQEPGAVHSGSASWDDCGRVFPEIKEKKNYDSLNNNNNNNNKNQWKNICILNPSDKWQSSWQSSKLLGSGGGGDGSGGGSDGFLLACEGFERMFDTSFPACAFFFFLKWRLGHAH